MTRYRFIGVWRFDGDDRYCNIECTRWELDGAILRVYDGDMFVGLFDMGRLDVAYFSEVA